MNALNPALCILAKEAHSPIIRSIIISAVYRICCSREDLTLYVLYHDAPQIFEREKFQSFVGNPDSQDCDASKVQEVWKAYWGIITFNSNNSLELRNVITSLLEALPDGKGWRCIESIRQFYSGVRNAIGTDAGHVDCNELSQLSFKGTDNLIPKAYKVVNELSSISEQEQLRDKFQGIAEPERVVLECIWNNIG